MVTSREPEDSDEDLPARERVMAHARGKAREVAERTGVPEGGAVLGADTEVVLDGRALGKAADRREAGAMLRSLAGRAHEVMSGVVLITAAGEAEALAVAEVRMRHLDEAMIEWYLGQGEWQGRAGGYAIQGRAEAWVRMLLGSHSGVVGLPLFETRALLGSAGIPLA